MARLLCLAAACSSGPAGAQTLPPAAADERDEALFSHWLAASAPRAAALAAFEQHLLQEGVAGELAWHQLLRSASSWKSCSSEPFAIPPQAQWADAAGTLKLLRELRRLSLLGAVEVHSGYRDEALNRCAGGAGGSAHWRRFALDITPSADAGADASAAAPVATRLCSFWREHGERWQMGFGRYPSGRLHIDTMRWRTWGVGCE